MIVIIKKELFLSAEPKLNHKSHPNPSLHKPPHTHTPTHPPPLTFLEEKKSSVKQTARLKPTGTEETRLDTKIKVGWQLLSNEC